MDYTDIITIEPGKRGGSRASGECESQFTMFLNILLQA